MTKIIIKIIFGQYWNHDVLNTIIGGQYDQVLFYDMRIFSYFHICERVSTQWQQRAHNNKQENKKAAVVSS